MLRSTETPIASAVLLTHDSVSWPAMASACQVKIVRKSSAAMATRRYGLLSEVTASLLQAVCEVTAQRRLCVRPATLPPYPWNARDLGQWLCVPPFRVVCPFRVMNLSVPYAGLL